MPMSASLFKEAFLRTEQSLAGVNQASLVSGQLLPWFRPQFLVNARDPLLQNCDFVLTAFRCGARHQAQHGWDTDGFKEKRPRSKLPCLLGFAHSAKMICRTNDRSSAHRTDMIWVVHVRTGPGEIVDLKKVVTEKPCGFTELGEANEILCEPSSQKGESLGIQLLPFWCWHLQSPFNS